MAYVTTDQLKARLGDTMYARLTDRIAGATASTTIAQELIDEAEAIVNSRLAVRYATPVDVSANAAVAAVLLARVLDVAEGLAWRASPFVTDVPDRVRVIEEDAERWLASVASGGATLPGVPSAASAPAGEVHYTCGVRAFTSDELNGL